MGRQGNMPSLNLYRTTYTEVCDGELVDPDTVEESEDCTPDQWDTEDGVSAVDKAVEFLANESITEASSSQWHRGLWYSYVDGSYCSDYRTGEQTEVSAHLDDGWTDDQAREIFERVTSN
jgi:hypothetical protein